MKIKWDSYSTWNVILCGLHVLITLRKVLSYHIILFWDSFHIHMFIHLLTGLLSICKCHCEVWQWEGGSNSSSCLQTDGLSCLISQQVDALFYSPARASNLGPSPALARNTQALARPMKSLIRFTGPSSDPRVFFPHSPKTAYTVPAIKLVQFCM